MNGFSNLAGRIRAGRAVVAAGLVAAVSAASLALASAATASVASNPAPQQVHPSVEYTASHGTPVRADIYSPTSGTGLEPIVIVVHGGGWAAGNRSAETPYSEAMAAKGFVVINVDYTLFTKSAPGYSVQVQEIEQAVKWSIKHGRQYGGDPSRIAIIGFSAGAYLSAMAGLLQSGLPGHPIKAVVTLSAPFDFPVIQQMLRQRVAMCGYATSCPQDKQDPPQDSLSAFATMYDFLGCPKWTCSSKLLSSASPISHVSAKAPPFLIFNSSNELIPRSQATDMASALQHHGVPVQTVILPGSVHGAAYLPEVNGTILNFLHGRLGTPGPQPAANDASTAGSSSSRSGLTVLVVCCLVVVAGILGVVAFALRLRRRATGFW